MKTVSVPMAIDARLTIPLGPFNISLRSLALALAVSPLAYLSLSLPLDGVLRLALAIGTLGAAVIAGLPEREGIWVGTWLACSLAGRRLPSLIRASDPGRARVRRLGEALLVGPRRPALSLPAPLDRWSAVLRLGRLEEGLLERRPGGWCAVLRLEGPEAAPQSEAYVAWSENLVAWLLAVGCPVQLIARATNIDRADAEAVHEARSRQRTRLAECERKLAGQVAARTLLVRNYAVLLPGLAGGDGVPHSSRLMRLAEVHDCAQQEAERALRTALRLAGAFGVACSALPQDELHRLAGDTLLGAREATGGEGVVALEGGYSAHAVVLALPPRLLSGAVVAAMLRARVRGTVSLHLLPVDAASARKHLNRQRAAYRYAGRHSSDLDAQLMVADTEALLTALTGRRVAAVRLGLAFEVRAAGIQACEEALERVRGALAGEGVRSARVTVPAFLAAAAASPGGMPLARGLLLTTDGVAACLLPALGTPFGDPRQPLVGVNTGTGGPAYLDVFGRPNHNAVIVGTSGAGKSVSAKALLLRHAIQGSRVIVIDPDSEYRLVLIALGGGYVELGESSLNALAVDATTPADESAGLVMPVLSVMGGEEVGYRDGRPIRRIPDADKAWLHEEVAAFFESWRGAHGMAEPVLSNLVRHLVQVAMLRCTSERARERCNDITLRLRGYTQGSRARVFDRPSTFQLAGTALGIGLRELALQFRADLTPALAVVLSRVLGMISRHEGRLIVLVDEAHRVTADPDAGQVLEQLVRQARKYGAGVWMASQSLDDFVRTDLGRVLAATAATKLVLGVEATVAEDARAAFGLSQQELAALSPRFKAGRGVLISGHERAVVDVVAGEHLMPLVSTGPAVSSQPAPAAGAA
jgi:hypothetical protein